MFSLQTTQDDKDSKLHVDIKRLLISTGENIDCRNTDCVFQDKATVGLLQVATITLSCPGRVYNENVEQIHLLFMKFAKYWNHLIRILKAKNYWANGQFAFNLKSTCARALRQISENAVVRLCEPSCFSAEVLQQPRVLPKVSWGVA